MSVHRRMSVLLGVGGALLASAGALLAVELALVGSGNDSLADERAGVAEERYSQAIRLAVVETWVPLFDRGVAQHHLARWDAATSDYREASALAPESARCMIHLNWSAALESGGDELASAEDLGGALARYQEAQIILGLVDCTESQSTASESLAQQWNESRQRLAGKQGATPPSEDPPPQGDDEDERQDALTEREQQAAEQRARAERSGDPAPGGSGQRTW